MIDFKLEYPRPQLVRNNWLPLNGEWGFDFDDKNIGHQQQWFSTCYSLTSTINVPYVYQCKNSGIHSREPHEYVWYKRKFTLPQSMHNKRIKLHFGAVDYRCEVYVNGQRVGEHEGGHTSFEFDITEAVLCAEENDITVAVFDPCYDETIPRGKQIWGPESTGIWYTNTTGIWQSVWLEAIEPSIALTNVKFTPDLDLGSVQMDFSFAGEVFSDGVKHTLTSGHKVNVEIMFKEERIVSDTILITNSYLNRSFDVFQKHIFRTAFHHDGYCWTPENPNLFDVTLTVLDANGNPVDVVQSYFGMRKVHQEKGMVYLNNRPYYQKLILDQGYWPDGLMTAPSDSELKNDIVLAKSMGFNGCRKHQKVEEARFLYWADTLGFLVWGECAAAPMYDAAAVSRMTREWLEIVERDYNHPCIITWVPINESWGVPSIARCTQQQHHSQAMYHLIHSIDPTRLVISNDGWELTKSDICAVHNYAHGNPDEPEKYQRYCAELKSKTGVLNSMSARRSIYAQGFQHEGEPILLTEFGGIGFKLGAQEGWGYTSVKDAKELESEYERIMKAIQASDILHGFCYTQLCDVEQEINGLLTYDRKPKCDIETIKKINDKCQFDVITEVQSLSE